MRWLGRGCARRFAPRSASPIILTGFLLASLELPLLIASFLAKSLQCLGFLLDAIHEDLNRVVGRKPYVEDVERVVEGKLTKEEDVMADEEVRRSEERRMEGWNEATAAYRPSL